VACSDFFRADGELAEEIESAYDDCGEGFVRLASECAPFILCLVTVRALHLRLVLLLRQRSFV
jgi:hypothetical protein